MRTGYPRWASPAAGSYQHCWQEKRTGRRYRHSQVVSASRRPWSLYALYARIVVCVGGDRWLSSSTSGYCKNWRVCEIGRSVGVTRHLQLGEANCLQTHFSSVSRFRLGITHTLAESLLRLDLSPNLCISTHRGGANTMSCFSCSPTHKTRTPPWPTTTFEKNAQPETKDPFVLLVK